jgi:UDP-2,4-diacetamido-2,4,6-trideoxy-beta-L-altropyranose hydrolase
MRIAIRADASNVIGSGHVMRCLTLADGLRQKGIDVEFLSRTHPGHLCDLIESRRFAVHRLAPSRPEFHSNDRLPHALWLGTDWETDARETLAAIKAGGTKVDWLVVDHYGLDDRWEIELRSAVGRILVLDDLADRPHTADLLLDQNLVANQNSRYSGLVAEHCGLLLGPRYALLQPTYADLHESVPARSGPVRRVLVYFGGAENSGLTTMAVDAWTQLDRDDVALDVAIGRNNPQRKGIEELIADKSNAQIHDLVPTLAPLMAGADLAIGAAGATSWERLCLGLPALVITLAANQRPIAEALHQRGLIHWLGHVGTVTAAQLQDQLQSMVETDRVRELAQRCRAATVDGRGTDRVMAAMCSGSDTPLLARLACPEDEDLLLEWANDPVTRKHAFSPAAIPAETHRDWFRQQLANVTGCKLFIVETDGGVPIGQVRFTQQSASWEVHYALASAFRGKKLGVRFLGTALERFRDGCPDAGVCGRVKNGNPASSAVLEALGFTADRRDADQIIYRHSNAVADKRAAAGLEA